METAEKNYRKLILWLSAVALAALFLLVAVIARCWPWFGEDTREDDPQPEIRVEAEEEIPTVTIPTPETEEKIRIEGNPYGPIDFQYNENNYLTCLAGEYRIGIDVSKYQYEIDWEQVAASGIEFAMIRIGYRGYGSAGTINEDPYARANLEGALAAGLDVGVYFFSQAITTKEAKEEAKFVLDYIAPYGDDITMPIVFDWELPDVDNPRTKDVDARMLTDCILEFCGIIRRAGYTPMTYFNTHQANYDLYLDELANYDFWLALYTPRMRFPYKVRMWQYTSSGSVPGIDYAVDLNIWFEYEE